MSNLISSERSPSKMPRHVESLLSTAFQSLFPAVNPQVTSTRAVRRVLLLDRVPCAVEGDEGSFVINLRHYAITTRQAGLSKPLKRLNAAEKLLGGFSSGDRKKQNGKRKGALPNLHNLEDVADYLIGGDNGEGYVSDATTGSEMDTDAEVEVLEAESRKMVGRRGVAKSRQSASEDAAPDEEDGDEGDDGSVAGTGNVRKLAIKLVELGPRMRLRLKKVEEGLCEGRVLWHEYMQKSPAEVAALEKKWIEKRARLKKQRLERLAKKKLAQRKAAAGEGGAGHDENADGDDGDGGGGYGEDVDMGDDIYFDEFDSEGLEGDAELAVNEQEAEHEDAMDD